MVNRLLSAVMGFSCRRPLVVGASVLVLAVAGILAQVTATAQVRASIRESWGQGTPAQ